MPENKPATHSFDTKQILSDPVSCFSKSHSDNGSTLTAIKTLWQKRQSLENRQKTIKTRTGILSRQIGEAKRKKLAVDSLITSMQTLSAENKSLSKQVRQINQNILSYFSDKPATSHQVDADINNTTDKRHYSNTLTNTDDIQISLFDQNGDPGEWNHFVSKNAAACIHHRIEWRNIHSQSYGHDSLYFCARDTSQTIVGILPLIHMKSRLFGNKLVSLPFFQRGGAIADSPFIESELMQAAATYGSKLGVDFIEYRDDIPHEHLPEPSAVQTHKVNMVLPLPDTQETLWQNFTSKLRAQIRRALREHAQVFIGGKEYLNDFYSVYSRNMRDIGSPVQSKHFINNILLHFPDNSRLIIIKLQQRPVAVGLLLGSGDTMEIPLASTIRDVNHLSINMLLYWEILKFSIKQGCTRFDFGRSSINAGTYRFKQQWGAKPQQLYWHYWLGKAEEPPSLNASNPRYSLIIKLWRRLPIIVANLLGPTIVRNLP